MAALTMIVVLSLLSVGGTPLSVRECFHQKDNLPSVPRLNLTGQVLADLMSKQPIRKAIPKLEVYDMCRKYGTVFIAPKGMGFGIYSVDYVSVQGDGQCTLARLIPNEVVTTMPVDSYEKRCVPGSDSYINCAVTYKIGGHFGEEGTCYAQLTGEDADSWVIVKPVEDKIPVDKSILCSKINLYKTDCQIEGAKYSVVSVSDTAVQLDCSVKSMVTIVTDSVQKKYPCNGPTFVRVHYEKRITVIMPTGLQKEYQKLASSPAAQGRFEWVFMGVTIDNWATRGISRVFNRPLWLVPLLIFTVFGNWLLTWLARSLLNAMFFLWYSKVMKKDPQPFPVISKVCNLCRSCVPCTELSAHYSYCKHGQCHRCKLAFKNLPEHIKTCSVTQPMDQAREAVQEVDRMMREKHLPKILRAIRSDRRVRLPLWIMLLLGLFIISELPVALGAGVTDSHPISSSPDPVKVVDLLRTYSPAALSTHSTTISSDSEPGKYNYEVTFDEEINTAIQFDGPNTGPVLSLRSDDWCTVYTSETSYWTAQETIEVTTQDFCTGKCSDQSVTNTTTLYKDFDGARNWGCDSATCATFQGGCTRCSASVSFLSPPKVYEALKLNKVQTITMASLQEQGGKSAKILFVPNSQARVSSTTINMVPIMDNMPVTMDVFREHVKDQKDTSYFFTTSHCAVGDCRLGKVGSFFSQSQISHSSRTSAMTSVESSEAGFSYSCSFGYGATCTVSSAMGTKLDFELHFDARHHLSSKFATVKVPGLGRNEICLRGLETKMSLKYSGQTSHSGFEDLDKDSATIQVSASKCIGKYTSLEGFHCIVSIDLAGATSKVIRFKSLSFTASVSEVPMIIMKGHNKIKISGFSPEMYMEAEIQVMPFETTFIIKGALEKPFADYTVPTEYLSKPVNHTRIAQDPPFPGVFATLKKAFSMFRVPWSIVNIRRALYVVMVLSILILMIYVSVKCHTAFKMIRDSNVPDSVIRAYKAV